MRISENFVAAVVKRFALNGTFFYLDNLPAGTLDVTFYRNGRALPDDLRSVVSGWWGNPEGGFDALDITSSLTQAVAFYVAQGRVGANVFSGNVSVTNFPAVQQVAEQGAFVHATHSVVNATQSLIAANAARKYLLIQNQDPSLNLYLRCDGAAGVFPNGNSIKLGPSQSWEPLVAPTGQIMGAMDAAGSPANNVHTIEA